MREVVEMINLQTGKHFPKGFFGEAMLHLAKREPLNYELVYGGEDEPEVDAKQVWSEEDLNGMNMKDLREIWKDLTKDLKEEMILKPRSKEEVISGILKYQV